MSRWILEKLIARGPTGLLAATFVHPQTNAASSSLDQVAQWGPGLPADHVWLSGWDLLGPAIFRQVQQRFWLVLAPMVCLVLLALWLAFHRAGEIVLSLMTLGLSCLCLLATMGLLGWSWNLLNLMALPLLLGTGVDYTIFMQLALRRHEGNNQIAYRSVGRALLLCGGTAVAGFGSLAFSTNAGMASLGKVCAVGIACNMLISIYLLPTWWQRWARALS
jgi:predicted RND superfamily exporter protein